jgi:hypothetical protein
VLAYNAFFADGKRQIAGRLVQQGYVPFTFGTVVGGTTGKSMVAVDATHPLLAGVQSFSCKTIVVDESSVHNMTTKLCVFRLSFFFFFFFFFLFCFFCSGIRSVVHECVDEPIQRFSDVGFKVE